jgi:phosphohistidine swiveling domain-containing protein
MELKFFCDRKNMYIFPWYISEITGTKGIAKIANGMKIKKTFIIIEKDFLTFYYDFSSANKIGRYFLKQTISDRNFLKKVVSNIYKYSEELEDFCRKTDKMKNLRKLSNKELSEIYSEYIKKLCILRIWGWVPPFIDGMEISFLSDYISAGLKKHLAKINRGGDFSSLYSILSSSEKLSEVQNEELQRLKMILKISAEPNFSTASSDIKAGIYADFEKKYPNIFKSIKKHLKDFGWLTYGYSGPLMTSNHLFKVIGDNLAKGNIQKQIAEIEDRYENIIGEKEMIAKEIGMPEKLKYLFKVSAEFMFIKDYRKGVYQKSYVAMDRVLDEIARRLKITLKGAKYLILPEIKLALASEKKAEYYRKAVEQRLKKCCFVTANGQVQVFEGDKCEQMIRENLKDVVTTPAETKTEQLTGKVAYAGTAKGVVKIVLIAEDVAKVNEGDILVSSATNPDLISAMKKAAAFVTDTGGIICHAAIVAREMKKPCVIGTRTATHFLHDGDIVEVDANAGVVKLIKKAS